MCANERKYHMKIASMDASHRNAVMAHIEEDWGLPVVTRGKIIDIGNIPGFVATDGDELLGGVLYQIVQHECEMVVLFSLRENRGSGAALVNAVVEAARAATCRRVWLITTNDNTHAMRFYQKHGFALKAAHINAFRVTQAIKGETGDENGLVLGTDGIPILHEMEFEMLL